MLALDVDGTLLDGQGRLTERVREAVRMARRSGLEVCLVSNRRPRSMAGLAQALELTCPLVAFNGGLVVDPATLRPLRSVTMPREVVGDTMRMWNGEDLSVFAYRLVYKGEPDIFYTRHPDWPPSAAYIAAAGANAARLSSPADMDWEPLRVVVRDGEEAVRGARRLAEPRLDLERVRVHHFRDYNGTWHYQVDPHGATKTAGLQYVCQHLGFSAAEVVAVGDPLNDLDLLEFAGLGVAMGNAQPELKRRADVVIGDHDRHGLAQFIEDLVAGRLAGGGAGGEA